MNEKPIKQLLYRLKNYKFDLTIVFMALITVALSLLSIGILFRKLVDDGLSISSKNSLDESIYSLLFFIIIFALGSFFRSFFINNIGEKIASELKRDIYANLLKVDIARFEEIKLGDIISRIGSDVNSSKDLVISTLSFLIRNSIMLFGSLTLMLIQSPKLAMLVMLSVPIILLPLIYLSKKVRRLSREVLEKNSHIATFSSESFSEIRTVYAYKQQQTLLEGFINLLGDYTKLSERRLKIRSIFFALAISCVAGAILMVIWIGSIDIINGEMSSGQMIAFIYYSVILGTSAGGIAEVMSELQGPLAAFERVIEMINLPSGNNGHFSEDDLNNHINISALTYNNELSINKTNFDELPSGIYFKDITFAYPSRPHLKILDQFNLEMDLGKFYGIVGSSGSGKTTLFQLLMRFYEYQSGQILIVDKLGRKIFNGDNLLKIAYVSQDPSIFSNTIKFNIKFSNPKASDEEVIKIASLCGIMDFAQDLPKGLDTEIGERAMRLSGGQKQRIAIARSLLYKPDILLLDEATSALDSQNEKKMLSQISGALEGKTIISIAHRISSVENADQIIVINKGKILDRGPHNTLLEKSNIYRDLVKSQKI